MNEGSTVSVLANKSYCIFQAFGALFFETVAKNRRKTKSRSHLKVLLGVTPEH